MTWLTWTLVAVLANGGWGTIARPLVDLLGWRMVAAMNTLGYMLPVPILILVDTPTFGGVTFLPALKAISVGMFSQLGVVMLYQALSSGGKTGAVVPIASLFPLVTIGGAVLFLDESPTVVQLLGALLAVTAVTLISVGSKPRPEVVQEEAVVVASGLEPER